MSPFACDFLQRGKDKPSLVQPRMRQHERRLVPHFAVVVENIEVEDAWGIALTANTTKPPLYRLQRGNATVVQ